MRRLEILALVAAMAATLLGTSFALAQALDGGRIHACFDEETRVLTLAGADGSCPEGKAGVDWFGSLDAAAEADFDALLLRDEEAMREFDAAIEEGSVALQACMAEVEAQLAVLRSKRLPVGDRLTVLTQAFNLQYLCLQQQMQNENRAFTLVSNIMKTKHDTVKNSIGNIR